MTVRRACRRARRQSDRSKPCCASTRRNAPRSRSTKPSVNGYPKRSAPRGRTSAPPSPARIVTFSLAKNRCLPNPNQSTMPRENTANRHGRMQREQHRGHEEQENAREIAERERHEPRGDHAPGPVVDQPALAHVHRRKVAVTVDGIHRTTPRFASRDDS